MAGATVPCKLFILPRYDSRYGQAILRWVSNSHSDRINLAIPRGVEPRTPLRQRGIIAVRPWDRNLMLAALVLTTFALAFRNGQADDQRLNSAGLGAPIPRSTVYIYDRWLNLVPHHRRVFNSGVLQPSVELGEPCFCRVSRTKT